MLDEHKAGDLVAFGPQGDRTREDLLGDVAAVRSQLPAPDPAGYLLLVFENDAYLAAVGLLAAWTAGHAVAVPTSTTAETMRGCLEDPQVRGLLHDTAVGGQLSIAALIAQAGDVASDTTIDVPTSAQLSVWSGDAESRTPASARDLGSMVAMSDAAWGPAMPARLGTTIWPGRFESLVLIAITALRSGGAFFREPVKPPVWPPGLEGLIATPAHLRTLCAESVPPRLSRILNVAEAIDDATKARVEEAFGCAVDEQVQPTAHDARACLARLLAEPKVRDAAVADLGDGRRWALVVGESGGVNWSRIDPQLQVAVRERIERDAAGIAQSRDILRAFGLDANAQPQLQTLNFSEPITEGDKTTASALVPANYRFFDGHFDGYPILPGVAQLHELVLPLTARVCPELGRLEQMLRLKFLGRVEPGDRAEVGLTFSSEAPIVDFEINVGARKCSAGRLRFCATGASS